MNQKLLFSFKDRSCELNFSLKNDQLLRNAEKDHLPSHQQEAARDNKDHVHHLLSAFLHEDSFVKFKPSFEQQLLLVLRF